MQKVAIVGVGLIGGSFGLALRKAGFTGSLIGVSSPMALEAGLQTGAISETAGLFDAVAQADLVYLSQPVDRILETIEKIGPMARGGTLITDAGSTKAAIVRSAREHVKHAQFVGGHPMAGKETRGALAADPDLFMGRPYVLERADGAAVEQFRGWLQRMGCSIVEMSPDEHDATVALTSHLPQLLSSALATFLAGKPADAIQQVHGSGLLDMTRLALSPAELWFSIIGTNEQNVSQAIGEYIELLTELKDSLATKRFEEIFAQASKFSRQLRKANH